MFPISIQVYTNLISNYGSYMKTRIPILHERTGLAQKLLQFVFLLLILLYTVMAENIWSWYESKNALGPPRFLYDRVKNQMLIPSVMNLCDKVEIPMREYDAFTHVYQIPLNTEKTTPCVLQLVGNKQFL